MGATRQRGALLALAVVQLLDSATVRPWHGNCNIREQY
jgi:hypothetical protein